MTGAHSHVPAVILAGGGARRYGGEDKALVKLNGQPLLHHVITALEPQVAALCLNGPERAGFDLPVISDAPEGRGPLAGVLAAMRWARLGRYDAVLTVAVDTPFLPLDLSNRLLTPNVEIAIAGSAGRAHHVIAVWRIALERALAQSLEAEPELAVKDFQAEWKTQTVIWAVEAGDPFFNINSPDDLARAQARIGR